MEILRLMKLMYLADRLSLKKWGHPIVGGHYSSLENGPVISDAYDATKSGSDWSISLERNINEMSVRVRPQLAELSKEDICLIDETHKTYRPMDLWQLVKHTHSLQEWDKKVGKSSSRIDTAKLLHILGKSERQIEEIKREESAAASLDSIASRK